MRWRPDLLEDDGIFNIYIYNLGGVVCTVVCFTIRKCGRAGG